MSDLRKLTEEIVRFRNERDWQQFHNPKDVALSLVLEAAEVLEHFQWKSPEEITDHIAAKKEDLAEELADVLYWVLLLSHDLDIDIEEVSRKKLRKNAEKYPVEKAKGSHRKYTEL